MQSMELISTMLQTASQALTQKLSQNLEDEENQPFMEDPHKLVLPYLWTIGIDIALFFALYKYTKYSVIVHSLISLLISLATLITALSILFKQGIQKDEEKHLERHAIIGICVMSIILVQIILGSLSSILRYLSFPNSILIYWLNVCHKYLGYLLITLAKIQAYLMIGIEYKGEYGFIYGLVASDTFLFVLLLARKAAWPTLSAKILPHNHKNIYKLVRNLSEIEIDPSNIGIFANYIYDLTPLKTLHPIGFKVIESVLERQLDRYLYGMYISELEAFIPPNAHGYKSLALVGQPIGKLNIPPNYTGMENDYVEVNLFKVRELSSRGDIYQVQLSSSHLSQIFEYRGYEEVDQLGRYFSLTVNKKITRLYSTVGFLAASNISWMKLEYFRNLPLHFQQISRSTIITSGISVPILADNDKNKLKLLIKKYPVGVISQAIIDEAFEDLWLSTSRGRGLRFGQLRPGKVMIIAGGTGLFPFCDLIDLLFKSTIFSKSPSMRSTLSIHDPVLSKQPFKHFTFQLFLSVNYLQDIHPLTLAQLNELAKHKDMLQLVLRVSKGQQNIQHSVHQNVILTKQKFIDPVRQKINTNSYERIWVCGPPDMNAELLQLFRQQHLQTKKYMIL